MPAESGVQGADVRTIGIGTDDGGRPAFVLAFGGSRPVRALVRASGAVWSKARSAGPETQVWTLTPSVLVADNLLTLASTHGFVLSADAQSALDALASSARTALNASRALAGTASQDTFAVPGLAGVLRPFQIAGVEFLVDRRTALLADDMGTGKTIQSLSALAWSGDYPALVICPAVVKLNWARECLTWFPCRTVSVLYGKPGTATTATPTVRIGGTATPVVVNDLGADIVVVNYDLVAAWRTRLGEVSWKAVIADEAHYLKTPTSARTKAIRALATGWDADQKKRIGTGIPTRYLLTGTPMLNRPVEVASLLMILGRLAEFGGYRGFTATYCNPRWTRFGTDVSGSANLPELNTRLRLACMIRRLKTEVLTELPAKTRTIIDVEIDNAAEYRKAERDVAAWIGAQAARDTTFLAGLDRDLDTRFGEGTTSRERSAARARAVSDQHVTAEARAARAEHLVRFSALKQLAARGKLAAITEWVTLFLGTGRKLVVFAHHREVVHALATAFGCDAITGETHSQDRQDTVDRFQNDPLVRVLCGNIRAGGVGITLTAASDVLFAELDWNPGVHEQAEDRVNRIGQVNACTAWYFLAQATIDQDIHALIEAKRRIVTAGTDGDVVTGSHVVGMLASGVARRVAALKDRTR